MTARTDVTTQPQLGALSRAGAVSSSWPREPNAYRWPAEPSSESELEQICRRLPALDGNERAYLLRALSTPTPDRSPPAGGPPISRRRIAYFLALCCLGLIPWTIGLAVTLPRSYLVANWPLAWVGFDIILLGCLGTTAWALWKRRQVAVVASMITSVLLFCDAWFDVSTAHSGRCLVLSIATAVFAEIPIGILLGLISMQLQRASRNAAQRDRAPSISLWRLPLTWPGGDPWKPIGRRSQPVEGLAANVPAANERKELR